MNKPAMEERNCPICSKSTDKEIFVRAHAGGIPFNYVRCCSCGLVFLNPCPRQDVLPHFYSGDYYGEGLKKFRSWIEPPRLFFARSRVGRIKSILPRRGRVLDIGCGRGTFLRLLKDEGWECHGTELSQETADRASRGKFPVSVGDIQENQFPPDSLDLVTLWHVLEHLPDPLRVFKHLRSMVKKNGIVAISTPNIDSLQGRVFLDKWFHLDPPRHVCLFSSKSLEKFMNSLGFRLLKIHYLSMEQNPYGWIQSLLNCTNLPENGLYTILKDTPSLRRKELSPLQQGKILLLAAGLFPTCFLLSLGMAALKRGGTIEAYFAKGD